MRHRRDIDGLRTLAVVPVALFHAHGAWAPGGYAGVDIFFVISGFLIASLLYEEARKTGRISILGFYERRARRILPALATVCAISLIPAYLISTPRDLADHGLSVAAAMGFAANFHFKDQFDYFFPFAEFAPLLHTWSLAVEEQFYLLFPLLVMLGLRRWRRAVIWVGGLALIGSLGLSVFGTESMPKENFYLLPARLWELGLGAALAGLLASGRGLPDRAPQALREAAAGLGLALILGAIILFDRNVLWPGWGALVPCLGAALVLWAGAGQAGRPTLAARLLSLAPMTAIGLISYSFYLWHWPVLAFLRQWRGSIQLSAVEAATALAAALLLAFLSWRFVEQPFRNRAWLSRPQVLKGAVASILLLAGMGLVPHLFAGWPDRMGAQAQIYASADEDFNPAWEECDGLLPPNLCREGDPDADSRLLLWGDSHAAAIISAAPMLAPGGETAWLSIRSACPPALGVLGANATDMGCVEHNAAMTAWAKAEAEAGRLTHVLLAGRWPIATTQVSLPFEGGRPQLVYSADGALTGAEALERGLDQLVASLRESGLKVVLLGNAPEVGWDVPRELSRATWAERPPPAPPGPELLQERQTLAAEILQRVAAEHGARYLPLQDALCQPDCRVEQNGHALYIDDDHLSDYAPREVIGPWMKQQLADWRAAPAVTD